MSAVTARFAAAISRLTAVFGDSVTFRGVSISVILDLSPKPERLPLKLLDLEGEVQAAFVTLPFSAVAVNAPPLIGEELTTATHRYRIAHAPRHLGHAYELPCVVSAL